MSVDVLNMEDSGFEEGGTNGTVEEMHAERNGSYGGKKKTYLYAMILGMFLLKYARFAH